jgi:hypothetical protein
MTTRKAKATTIAKATADPSHLTALRANDGKKNKS